MVDTNINCNGKDNIIKSTFWILSIISWLLLIFTEIFAFYYLNHRYIIWTFYRIPIINFYGYKTPDNPMGFYPIQMISGFIYIVFIILLLFTIVAFCYYLIKSTCKKDDSNIFNLMNGEWTKYHFIPLLFASGLFLIGETIGDHPNHKSMNICGLIFVILGLASLIFITIKTELPGDWLSATIKKGTYSCLIALEWYYFCYDICNLKINNITFFEEDWRKELKIYSGVFSVLMGLVGLFLALFFKDVVMGVMYFLIYLGCTIFFFSIDVENRKFYNKYFDGIVDIIMMILFAIEIAFIIIKYKINCLK